MSPPGILCAGAVESRSGPEEFATLRWQGVSGLVLAAGCTLEQIASMVVVVRLSMFVVVVVVRLLFGFVLVVVSSSFVISPASVGTSEGCSSNCSGIACWVRGLYVLDLPLECSMSGSMGEKRDGTENVCLSHPNTECPIFSRL